MGRARWTGGVLTAALLATTVVTVAPAHAVVEPPIPIHLIEVDRSSLSLSVSADGRYIFDGGAVIDTHTHTATELGYQAGTSARPATDGSIFGVLDGKLVESGAARPQSTVPLQLPDGWDVVGVIALAPGGGLGLVSGRGPLPDDTGAFVVDLETGDVLASEGQLTTGTLRGSTTWFLDDGTIVVAQFDLVGQRGFSSYAVWTPDLLSVSTIDPPAEHDMNVGPFFVDRNLEYAWFATDAGGIVDGIGAGPGRMYRRHIATGDTVAAPIDVLTAARLDPMPDGGLLLAVDLPPGQSWNRQLFRWDGSSDATEQLTVGFDGGEPTGAVVEYVSPQDGDVITLASRAANLSPAIPHAYRDTYLYQITSEIRPGAPPLPDHPDPLTIPLTQPQAATEPAAPVGPNETYCVPAVGARPGEFVGANITPVNAVRNGNGSLHSSDDEPPSTANVNFRSGSVDPNVAFAQVGLDRTICFTNSHHGPVDVVIDALVVAEGDAFRLPSESGAVRIADTRDGLGGDRLAARETRCVEAPGAAAGEFAGVNITPVGATTRGNGALHSSDDEPPGTANVNFAVGSVDPNLAVARVGADGTVCFSNSVHGPVDIVMDLLFVTSSDAFRSPGVDGAVRVVDTRSEIGAGRFAADETQCFRAVGAQPAEWVGLNLTPINATTNGNGAAHSSDEDPPATANVNFRAASVDPNLAIAGVGSSGDVCFSNSVHGPVDLVGDELFVAGAGVFRSPTADGAVRLTDTRNGRHDVPNQPPTADQLPTLTAIEQAADLRLIDASDDGRYVVLGDPLFDTGAAIEVETGEWHELDHQPNRLSLIDEQGTIFSTEAGAITVEPFGGVPTMLPSALPNPWFATQVLDVDPTRQRLLVRAGRDAGFTFGLFLVDIDAGTSLNGPSPLPSATGDETIGWFRPDGTFVTGRSPQFSVWNAGGTSSTLIDNPPGGYGGRIDPTASYLWFFSDAGGLVPGLEAGTIRMYRRTLETGATIVAPARVGSARQVELLPDGSVIVITDDSFTDDPVGLYHWDGTASDLRRLDVRVDGSEPNSGPFVILPPREGSIVTFTTFATDLGTELIRPGRYANAYQVDVDG